MDVIRVVEAPTAAVWSLLVDTERWPDWGPSITSVECATRVIDANSRGRVRTALGLWLPFEVVAFEEGRAWRWRVGGVPATGHRVEALGPSRCRVVFELPLWAWPYAVVCRRALSRIASAAGTGAGVSAPSRRATL